MKIKVEGIPLKASCIQNNQINKSCFFMALDS
jgi:hypothetical protein